MRYRLRLARAARSELLLSQSAMIGARLVGHSPMDQSAVRVWLRFIRDPWASSVHCRFMSASWPLRAVEPRRLTRWIACAALAVAARQTAKAQSDRWHRITPRLLTDMTIWYDGVRTTHAGDDTIETWLRYRPQHSQLFDGQRASEWLVRARIACNYNQVETLGGEILAANGNALAAGYQAFPNPSWQDAPPDSYDETVIEGVCIGEARWIPVTEDDGGTISVAAGRVVISARLRDAWVRITHVKPLKATKGDTYSTTVQHTRTDCSNLRYFVLELMYLKKSGEPLAFAHYAPPVDETSWDQSQTGTNGEVVNRAICGQPVH